MPIFETLRSLLPRSASRPASPPRAAASWPLDTPLFRFPGWRDSWTLRHSFEGALILGRTGSGKTSGSGALLAKNMLRVGYGGLVLCAKTDEARLWEDYARETGRAASILRFAPGEPWRFNFLEYEARRASDGSGNSAQAHNLVELLLQVVAAVNQRQREASADIWQKAMRQLVANAVELLLFAGESITMANLYRLITSAPHSPEEAREEDWQQDSYLWHLIEQAEPGAATLTAAQAHDRAMVKTYWLNEHPALADKTRASIVLTFTATVDPLLRGVLHELFCTELNCAPDPIMDGAVVIVDLSVKEWNDVGRIAATIWKFLFQRAIERRPGGSAAVPRRPVFLWADECQHFVTDQDALFQTTARSAGCATVFLTQNLPNLYAELGGSETGKARVDSLLGNLGTKFFHRNDEHRTNQWASEIVSRILVQRRSQNSGAAVGGSMEADPTGRFNAGASTSEQMDFELPPRSFLALRTGSPEHGYMVDCLVFQSGRMFGNGTVYLPTSVDQRAT
jgi:type IV secretory pathway TraG/TraD family ATPase VirD4